MRTKTSPLTDVSKLHVANSRDDTNPAEYQVSLQRASKTLRGIRERFQTECSAHPGARFYGMHVALDAGDMAWITAAIESVERVLAGNRRRNTRITKAPLDGPTHTPLRHHLPT